MWKKLWGELRNHSGKNHDLSRAKRDYLPLIPRVWVMNDVFDEANICNKHSPPLLLCTRAPGRRRALGGSLARRQQQNPPPKEPRKRRQRAPSWATAPLANSLGTRSVWSSRRGRTLRNHSWLLAESWPDVQSSGNPCSEHFWEHPGGMETILTHRVPLVGPSVSSGFCSNSWNNSHNNSYNNSCPGTNMD